ncbi:exocyst complex component [Achlya hypogyna]|uniref:Exocyst complex component n=1 Tax=Achlya hypogyna TaxID=1202772 RepID=A0A1V9ZFQ5_ACHHY|nr:exocyst complex component [Achlya hypogyna]
MKDERSNSRKECELLVHNIAQSHARLAPGIQCVLENQWESTFADCLTKCALDKEEEIRDVCSAHYQEFVQSIEEIVQIKCDAAELMKHLTKYQHDLVAATSDVLAGSEMLATCLVLRKNIDSSMARLQQCQRIVHLAAKVDDYIQQAKFYHALKLLDRIRADIAGLRGNIFARRVHDWVGATTMALQEQTTKKTSSWLEEIRAAAIPIGAHAMKSCEETMALAPTTIASDGLSLPSLDNLAEQATAIRARNTIHSEYVEKTLQLLTPMLRIVHVYGCLGKSSELAAFYHTNRMPQLQFSAFLSGNIGSISPEKFALQHDDIFKRFVGTFCLEKMLAIYADEVLLTKSEVHAACMSVLQSLCGLIMALLIKMPSPKVVLDIKRNAILCARVLGNDVHQFNTALVYDAFRGMGDYYRKKTAADLKGKLRQFMADDTFQQVTVTKEQCAATLQLYGLQSRCDEFLKSADSRGQIILPFTSVVQRACQEVHEMVATMFEFEWHLNIPEWGYFVRDDTWEAMVELSAVLNEHIERNDELKISQAVITGANASYLSGACDVLAQVLAKHIEAWELRTRFPAYAPKVPPRATAAVAKKKFESSSTKSQDMVCELMVKKIDDLIGSFYFVNWTAADVAPQADPCMSDLINYLQASFTQLSTLPVPIREAVHFASCIHINKALEQVLVGSTIKRVTMTGLLNFKRSLDALMQFANTCNVTQLRECFLPLTQLVDLVVSPDLERVDASMFSRTGGKYTHVMPDQVIAVLEKYKDTAPATSKFFKSKKPATADGGLKKSVVDAVVKQLRTMSPHAK